MSKFEVEKYVDPLYLIALDYEYKCEVFDRSQRGYYRVDVWIPYGCGASLHASELSKKLSDLNRIPFSKWRKALPRIQRLSFDELRERWEFYLYRKEPEISCNPAGME